MAVRDLKDDMEEYEIIKRYRVINEKNTHKNNDINESNAER